jgi:EmrB/QacA subfamily drug resistance transporter
MTTSETRWLRVVAIAPAVAMSFMDQSILPVALPTIQQEFGAADAPLQWTVNVYLLTTSVFILLGGKFGDRYGHRKTYLAGLILFGLFSALCSLSSNVWFLIAARALQGLGAAIMFPSQTSLIAMSFPPHSRGRATGIVVSIGALFAVLGPLIGGFLTEHLSWHWIFWINMPITIAGVILSLWLLPETPVKKEGKIDRFGFVYFALFATAITMVFMQAPDWGWGSFKILFCLALSLLSLLFLFKREKKAAHPFLEITLFKRPIFAAINMTIAITQFIMMISVFRTIYTEEILGYSPTETGLITSLSCLPLLFASYLAGFLADKISPKLPIGLGYLFIVSSFFWLGANPTPSLHGYFIALLIFGIGIPFIFTPSYTVAMSTLPPAKFGVAFGLIATLRTFAGTMGLSLIYLLVKWVQSVRLVQEGARSAEISSFSFIHYFLGISMIGAFLFSFFTHRRKAAHQLPDVPAEGWD